MFSTPSAWAASRGLARHIVDRAGVGRVDGPDDVLARAVAVVVHGLGHAVAVGVEQLADMRQAVPLGRVLQVQDHRVVVDDVGQARVVEAELIVHVRPAVAQRGSQHRRVAPRVEHVAAGIVERQAQAERKAFADFRDALLDLVRRKQVEAPELVVRPEIPPGGAFRPPLPPGARCHSLLLPPKTQRRGRPPPEAECSRAAGGCA